MEIREQETNHVKSYLGKNVNLHLKDGSVIVNVKVTKLQKDIFGFWTVHYAYGNRRKHAFISLRRIAQADPLNMNFLVKT